jgi:type III restriction enzyme
MDYEVDQPILNSPYEEPKEHWLIVPGETPQRVEGRRKAMYYYRAPKGDSEANGDGQGQDQGVAVELPLVNLVRERLGEWRSADYPGVSRITLELLRYWRRDGRQMRLFFAQLEAVETVIFLTEARADLLQGIEIPLDEPGEDAKLKGVSAFRRYACKMATGTGKTMVMGMVAAWSILNKVSSRADNRFSDTVLVVCPNVTIRSRLQELDPGRGEASIYRVRDLVPAHLMPDLSRGRVIVTNWHVFEPQAVQSGGTSARVVKAGVPVKSRETITIGSKTGTSRGYRYLTQKEYERQVAAGTLTVREEIKDTDGNIRKVVVDAERWVESDTRVVERVLGRQVGGKKNILVFNDEAHHAYRIRSAETDEEEDEEEDEGYTVKEATVWVEGLDRVHSLRGINFCLDLSATPYYLGRVGQATNQTFPWVASDFGLTDAIESGLVKIPQLVVRDTTGAEVPGYFNIWRYIMDKLTTAERGAAHGNPRPEAILKHANHPISLLGANWEEHRASWEENKEDPRPPVFILVCKTTKIAKVIYEWIAENKPPVGIPSCGLSALRNTPDVCYTIRVDSKVVHETDSAEAKSDESAWMRFTLDTVGKLRWPEDSQARPLYPEGFEDVAKKLGRPLHPPGRDVRCIVSVGMLTEGWDCNTVTHIVGLRPFMSQLLCEQVVGRGLRRASYELGANGHLTEEVAKVFGVPFEIVPFKATGGKPPTAPEKRHHVHALPAREAFAISFPRVVSYRQSVRNRVTVPDWDGVPTVTLDPTRIPPEVEVKANLGNNVGRPALSGPGKLESLDFEALRKGRRLNQLAFEISRDLTRDYLKQAGPHPPAHALYPQMVPIVLRFLEQKVKVIAPADRLDVFLSPYYGLVIERLVEAIKADTTRGEEEELPVYETNRGPGSTAEVDFWTSREVREISKSHLNYAVADTKVWEQAAAYAIDTHPEVDAFVKNAGLGFAIPYLHDGKSHDYVPDFIIRLKTDPVVHLILETKGHDDLAEIKAQAAERWVKAVNADGRHGTWRYTMVRGPGDVAPAILKASVA